MIKVFIIGIKTWDSLYTSQIQRRKSRGLKLLHKQTKQKKSRKLKLNIVFRKGFISMKYNVG